MSDPINLPKLPKSIGMSKRLLFTLLGAVIFLMCLFVLFVHQSSAPKKVIQRGADHVKPDNSTSASMIEKLEGRAQKPLLLDEATSDNKSARLGQAAVKNDTQSLSDGDFKQGGEAEISVYRNIIPDLNQRDAQDNTEVHGVNESLPGTTAKMTDDYSAQNAQLEKTAFLKASPSTEQDTISSALQKPRSPYEIKAGTLIPATLMTGINSDLPGTIIAKVRSDVFDTATGNYLLIPQGTTLLGVYDSQVAYGQSRVLIAWSRLIFPNGDSFDLAGQPGVDLIGMAGLHDLVDNHYLRLFGSALLFSTFGAAGQLSQPENATGQLTTQQTIYSAIGQQLTQTGAQLAQKNMNIQPTIEIRPGSNFNVLLSRDIILPMSYRF